MVKFAFILLNYNTFEDTISLIESIKGLNDFDNDMIRVIVVDNDSPNNSGEFLKKKYENSNFVDVLLSNRNLGFAKGNNLGFRFAVDNFNPKFIVMSNTDIEIITKNFFELVEKKFNLENFAVLGPNIIKPLNRGLTYQNPYFYDKKITTEFIKKEIMRINKNEILRNIRIMTKKIPFTSTIYNIVTKTNDTVNSHLNEDYSNFVTLSGAFMIFSTKYISILPNGLSEETFMYGEEHFLSFFCQKYGLKIVYTPDLEVYHFEGKSTASVKSEIQRNRFLRKESTKSLRRLIKIIHELESEN